MRVDERFLWGMHLARFLVGDIAIVEGMGEKQSARIDDLGEREVYETM